MVIFYVCADASTKKVLLHSYVKNQTNNFSKFLVNRFVWWETDWFLFEVCGAHREARQIKEVFGCNMLIYFRNDHHFVATTYILHWYDEKQIDFYLKSVVHIEKFQIYFIYLPIYGKNLCLYCTELLVWLVHFPTLNTLILDC